MIVHRSLVNLCYWHIDYFGIMRKDRAAQYANTGFDASVWEIFPYLVKGASLYIIPAEIKPDIMKLDGYYARNHITVAFLPTQFCERFTEQGGGNRSLRILLTGGDRLRSFYKIRYLLYNNYGPTENTVVSTSWLVTASNAHKSIPIGKPIANHKIYILQQGSSRLQPLGIAGEL